MSQTQADTVKPDGAEDEDATQPDAPAADDGLAEALAEAADALDGAGEAVQQPEPEGEAPVPSAQIQAEAEANAPAEADVLAAELAETKDRLLRAMAETENIRRRAERDKGETAKYAIANFARDMLGVADNVRRALDTIDEETRKSSEALDNFIVGLEMVERETLSTLERHGVRRIEALGQRFDSNLHEAMYEYEDPSQPAGSVGQVVETGFTLHDRLLRPSKVGVTKGGPKVSAAPAAAEAPTDPAAKGASTAYEGPGGAQGETLDESL